MRLLDHARIASALGPTARLRRKGSRSALVWVLFGLVLGGCAQIEQIAERGGLIRRIRSGSESSEPTGAPRWEPRELPEIPMPYKPADFQKHGGDGEFAWHWTASRTAEHVEVKGLIENKTARTVRGVTFSLSGPEGAVTAESPGMIRAGQLRPFYFRVQLPGDERQAQLSVVAFDPEPFESESKPPPQQAAVAPGETGESFTDRAQDHFFTLQWNSSKKDGEVEVHGLVENRSGPPLREVVLLIQVYDSAGEAVGTARQRIFDVFEKRETRPFTVLLRVKTPPERVSVSVDSYQFFAPGGD